MDLTNAFNGLYEAKIANPFVLDLYYRARGGCYYVAVDFLTRTMVTRTGSSDGGVFVTPFSQMDREVLEGLRDKLVELGGTPPELEAQPPANPGTARRLNP